MGFFKKQTMTVQIMICFMIIVGFFAYLSFGLRQKYLTERELALSKERIIYEIKNSLLNLEINEKEFMLREQASEVFYQKGQSIYRDNFFKELNDLNKNLVYLKSVETDPKIDKEIIELQKLAINYKNEFVQFSNLFKTLGYNEWGMAGDLHRKQGEIYLSIAKKNKVIALLDSETDKAVFQNIQNENEVKSYQLIIRSAIQSLRDPKEIKILREYQNIANMFVKIYKEIGFSETDGLQGKMSDSIESTKPVISNIITAYKVQELNSLKKLNDIKIGEFFILVLFLLTVLFISKSISKNMREFTDSVRRVKNHDWNKKVDQYNSSESLVLANEINGMIDILKDTTIDLQEKNRLYSSDRSLQDLLKNLHSCLWSYDFKTKSFQSDESGIVLGYSAQEFNENIELFRLSVLPEDKVVMEENFKKLLKNGITDFDYRIVKKDSSVAWINAKVKIIYDENKSPISISGMSSNIEERKKTEEIIKTQEVMLMQSAKMSTIGEISSSIIHDIKNPLAIISATSELVGLIIESKEHPLNDQIQSGLDSIDKSVNRIDKIIKSMTATSRSVKDAFQDIYLNDVINDSLEIVSGKAKKEGVKITVDSSSELFVKGRASDLGQVLINLINNGVDAVSNQSEKWIKIESRIMNSKIQLSVTDSGKGISPEVVKKMFGSFFTTKEIGKGTGLGLSISKKVIDEHNGLIYCDQNCPNTKFVIEFPLPQSESKAS